MSLVPGQNDALHDHRYVPGPVEPLERASAVSCHFRITSMKVGDVRDPLGGIVHSI